MVLYEVPLVSANLRPQEMISQMVDTLEYLDQLSNDMFARVSLQLQQRKEKISVIQRRIEAANSKINSIKGSKKATKVFSCSKFPASLKSEATGIFNGPKTEMKKMELKAIAINQKVDSEVIFYPNNNQTAGKMPFPPLPKSVSELLVFNSEDLAFWEQPASERSSKAHLRQKQGTDTSDGNVLGDAPWSISQRESVDRENLVNFSYVPGLGDVPELNLPLALPDLPGIADDLAYSEDIGPGIAPSLMAVLPDIVSLTDNTSSKPLPTPPPPPSISFHEPPPEPKPISQPVIRTSTPISQISNDNSAAITYQPIVVPAPAPPPPPPPPPPAPAQPVHVQSPVREAERPRPPAGDDMRSNLMAAIREAGGVNKLKSSARVKHTQAVKEHQEQVAVNKGKPATSNPAGDLMADLFNKLSMRRKGISGQNAEEGGSSNVKGEEGDAMARISQMIPPPPPPGGNMGNSDELDDWK